MDVDIISPKLLLKDFLKSIEGYKGLFFVVPIAIGIVMCLFLKGENKDVVEDFINSSLTSFVPIFATILSVYISWFLRNAQLDMKRNVSRYFKRQPMKYSS